MQKKYCIDLDDTICFPNHEHNDSVNKYLNALPNTKIINQINKLFDQGAEINIFTARRMLTHDGNLKKILKDF